MTNTNRFANRLLILLVGLILLSGGIAAVALALFPTLATAWNQNAPHALSTTESVLRSPVIPGTSISWVMIGALAVLVILIILLIVFIFRQGRGHTGQLITQQTSENRTIVIESGVAAELLRDALAGEPEILAAHITAYQIKGTAALKITVTCRRGASPKNISTTIERALTALDSLIGVDVPTLIQISGGFRTRLAASARFDQSTLPSNVMPAATSSPAAVAAAE
ncbi:hypothetical protein [Rathayibacter soli]|uniref:hypothetical protein n=1 Tax=Rathayibacter soli TaxID=3144168 RepID=UPI0027E5781F|nr:hypothetical protein [Glaciibacter superstes]